MIEIAEIVNERARRVIESTEENTIPPKRNPFYFSKVAALVEAMNEKAAVVTYDGKVRVLLLDRPHDPPISFPDASNLFAKWTVEVGEDVKNGFEVWRGSAQRREFDGIEFQPDLTKADPRKFNKFTGFAVQPVEGDCTLIRAHIRDVICSGDLTLAVYVERWCADLIQNPGRKNKVALILRGGKQTGKSYLSDYLAEMIGHRYAPVLDDPQLLTAKHNSDLETALLLCLEEGFWAGNKADEGRLKNLISGKRLRIEAKYENGATKPSFCRVIMTANEDHVAPVSGSDVRYCVIDVSPAKHGDTAYWRALSDERDNGGREAFLHYLQHLELAGFDAQDVPLTDALADQARLSLSAAEAWWASFLETGELPSLGEEGVLGQEWSLDKPLDIERAQLFESFRAFAPGFRNPPSPAALGRFLAKHCPGVDYVKVAHPFSKSRVNAYRLPPRSAAIVAFQAVHPRVVLVTDVIDDSDSMPAPAPQPRPSGVVVQLDERRAS